MSAPSQPSVEWCISVTVEIPTLPMAIFNREASTSSRGTMKDRRIIVSIDFGTTYSGVAWAETSRVRDLDILLPEKKRVHANKTLLPLA